jgi:glycosidase
LRKNYPALYQGGYQPLVNGNDHVFSFLRSADGEKIVVVVNLSAENQRVEITLPQDAIAKSAKGLLDKNVLNVVKGKVGISLPGYGLQIFRLN